MDTSDSQESPFWVVWLAFKMSKIPVICLYDIQLPGLFSDGPCSRARQPPDCSLPTSWPVGEHEPIPHPAWSCPGVTFRGALWKEAWLLLTLCLSAAQFLFSLLTSVPVSYMFSTHVSATTMSWFQVSGLADTHIWVTSQQFPWCSGLVFLCCSNAQLKTPKHQIHQHIIVSFTPCL